MIDSNDRSAIRLLAAVASLMGIGLGWMVLSVMPYDQGAALAMVASALVGAVAASTFWVSRGVRRRAVDDKTPPGVRALVDRLERLEDDHDVVAQLEERLEFTERLLAEQRNPPGIARPEATS